MEVSQLPALAVRDHRVADPLVSVMGDALLGVEAFRRVKLHLEPLSVLSQPSGVDALVLLAAPGVLAQVHLASAAGQLSRDAVIASGIVSRLEAERIANRVRDLTENLAHRHTRFGLQLLGDLLLEAVVVLEPVLEALQPAAMLILLLDRPYVRRDGRFGLAHPADRRDRLRVPFRLQVEAAAAAERPRRIIRTIRRCLPLRPSRPQV